MRPVGDEPERPTSAVGVSHPDCLLLAEGPPGATPSRGGLGPWVIQFPATNFEKSIDSLLSCS